MSAAPTVTCWQESATRWHATDPHTRAYAALQSELAKQIITQMGWEKPATAEPRCLSCHTTPSLAAVGGDDARRAEGVGCAACHGDSDRWLRAHTAWGRAADRAETYDTHGMTRLYDPGVRAKACAGCHVGAPATDRIPVRDMNHDMIAAGHPRLDFDFAEYHRRLPKHWVEEKPIPETQLWLIGRVAHAEAACELLADRATRADPWPEFAEFRCIDCHHRVPGTKRSTAGVPRWQSVWPLTTVELPETVELVALIRAMGQKKRGTPDAVRAKATAAAAEMAAWRTKLMTALDDADRFFPSASDSSSDRDDLAHLFHGLAARERDRPDGLRRSQEFAEAFDKFREWNPNAADPAGAEKKARAALNDLLRSR